MFISSRLLVYTGPVNPADEKSVGQMMFYFYTHLSMFHCWDLVHIRLVAEAHISKIILQVPLQVK